LQIVTVAKLQVEGEELANLFYVLLVLALPRVDTTRVITEFGDWPAVAAD
jgi:hypothetical protein